MWLKIVFILFFFTLLFILSRLVDIALNGCQLDGLLPYHINISPVGLSVRHLKQLLDIRGVNYCGSIEKQELIDLVESSGGITQEEFDEIQDEQIHSETESSDNAQLNNQVTKFTCGTHFYEEVEDTKDSAWLVSVIPSNGKTIADDLWGKIVRKSAKFGIRTGVFECFKDPYLCERKGWISPRIILAMPREGIKTKEDVVLMSYLVGTNSKEQHIINWVEDNLAKRIDQINSIEELNENWLQNQQSNDAMNSIKVVFISTLAAPPLILSALAIKFSGRIKFGNFKVTVKNKKTLMKTFEKRIPSYLIVTSERSYPFGMKSGERITYRSMEIFLRSLKPEMNDLFLLSIFLVNLSVGLHFFWIKCSKLWKHILYWFMYLVRYNCILFLIWLAILALNRFTFMDNLTQFGFKLCRFLAISHFASIIRYDFQHYYKLPIMLFTFMSLGTLLFFIRRKLGSTNDNDDQFLFIDWTPLESNFLSYILFRPIGIPGFRTMPSTSIDLNLEEGMEQLIERLAVPNLWLQPDVILTDINYIKDLPIWEYQDANQVQMFETDDESTKLLNVGNNHSNSNNNLNEISIESTSSNAIITSSHLPNEQIDLKQNSNCNSQPNSSNEKNNLKTTKNSLKHKIMQKFSLNRSQATKKKCQMNKLNESDKSDNENFPKGMIVLNECAICLGSYQKRQLICGLPCGHNYHKDCIMEWIYRDNHCCPICRWPSFKQKPKLN